MRVILSRVGVDSETPPNSNASSPVFSDGRFYSIAIPYFQSPVRYADLQEALVGINLCELTAALTKLNKRDLMHLDPDLNPASLSQRHPQWRPAYGQAGTAQSHLENEGVGVGDLFLFYGRFMPVIGPPWRRRKDPNFKNGDYQAVWSWLQVGEVVNLKRTPVPQGNSDHPHAHGIWAGKNVLYLAAHALALEGFTGITGAGILPRLRPITAIGGSASQWSFPREWFSKQRQEHVADSLDHPGLLQIACDLLSDLKDTS